jgi:RNA polymerase sigma factor (sigma-70 family)
VLVVLGRSDTGVMEQLSLAQSDATEFAQLVEPYLSKMHHLAERLGGWAGRDDIVQEALFNAWRKRAQFDPARGSLSGWLMAITADQARKSWRRRPLILPIQVSSSLPSSDDQVDLERALRRLSPRQRLAVDCFYFAGLSVAETATVMRCAEGTVKSTLSDARANLRPALEVNE